MIAFNLDSEVEAFIREYLKVSGNLSTSASIAQQRQDYEKICQHFRYPHPPGVTSQDSQVEGRHGSIKIRHYHCQKQGAAQMIFLHGGGFILGSLDSHDDVCAELCVAGGVDAVSIDYRLSPEYTHPVHLDDVVDAYLAVQKKSSVIVGISAGATLAAALSHRLKHNPQKPQGQVLIYPSLGGELFDLKSYADNAHAPLLCSEDIWFYRKARCGEGEIDLHDPEFYPLSAQDFAGLPRTIV
ncbi:MAG: alpha/beta hydrolase, partial [Gammaproteobacteria bacterium]|nr:alpha/beta hydrolase [Gammaproteobacteria bacterium]